MKKAGKAQRRKLLERLNSLKSRVEEESKFWVSNGLKITPVKEIVDLELKNKVNVAKLKENWSEIVNDVRNRKVQEAKEKYLFFSLWKHECGKITPELPDLHQIFDITPQESAKIQLETVDEVTKDL